MQTIYLGDLPDSIYLVDTYTETFERGHIIQRNFYQSLDQYVYVMGTSTTSGVHIMDISDPENPIEAGLYAPGYYIHDAHFRGDIMYAAAFYEPTIDIVDISNPAEPILISRITDPGGNTHSSWTSVDGNYLIVADELDGLPARIWDISDPIEPVEVATYTANEASLVHNPYVRGDFCFLSHNTEGLKY